MDEELGTKAPVTRLRRRLSTEAEGTQSPLTPSTPTKKRATRLTKPVLELIDENEKPSPLIMETATKKPIRRASTNIDTTNETPGTPSRRNTRIRSNTSLVLEAVQNIVTDSPRAKRALRRASQIGSDTESTTPARQTRRTRKDSTSSVEKIAVTNSNEKLVMQVAEPITEEPEKETDSKQGNSKNSTSARKSPRINKNIQKTGDESKQNDKALTNSPKLINKISSSPLTLQKTTQNNENDNSAAKDSVQNLSQNSADIVNETKTYSEESVNAMKTLSAIEELTNDKGNNRKRTKSWTTLPGGDPPAETINDVTKSAAGDGATDKIEIKSLNTSITKSVTLYNTSIDNKENIQEIKTVENVDSSDTVKILGKSPCKGIQSFVFMEDSDSNSGSSVGKLTMDINYDDGQKNEFGDQCVPVVKHASPKRLASESFSVEPMDIDETIPENVTINDYSDQSSSSLNGERDTKQNMSLSNGKPSEIDISSNKSAITSSVSMKQESSNSKRKSSITASEESNSSKTALNKSDKSLLTNKSRRISSISSQHESGDSSVEKSNKSKRKSSYSKNELGTSQVDENINKSLNKSPRKSMSEAETQNLQKSSNSVLLFSNENKSTLVLSQLKDVSSNETSNVAKSPNNSNNFSKSVNIPAKETDNDNLNTLKYLTSTPLQHKSLQKLAMQINTSVISPTAEIKTPLIANKSKTPVKNDPVAKHDIDSSSEESEDISMDKSKMIDDEAEEASDDYESGDSRNDEERQYEKDHEVPEQGETIESEQNFSNDSDYEKDSFVVSSDNEDDDLLSGSGDDLSQSDNELKMTAKSKMKFNERKRKQQKNASKEMYEARHNLNESDKRTKSKTKSQIQESIESESENEKKKPYKKNRLRIDSSQDLNVDDKDSDESVGVIKKNTKRLSESVYEGNHNENEITATNQSVLEKNDPLAVSIKQEPKTPQKDFNMSTVIINDNIEQMQLDSNTSVLKYNETSDPLQATLAGDDDESDSDISENMDIKQNYDSVLENLNKTNKKQKHVKTHDLSLNLNKKQKVKVNEPIVDELNLTHTKKSKKNKNKPDETNGIIEEPETTNGKKVSITVDKNDEGENSDCIDMRLLFSEDSNDSESVNKFKLADSKELADKFIPLKRTEAKTNIRESLGDTEGTIYNFFIDTKGDHEAMDTSTQSTAKTNKKKHKLSVSETSCLDDVEDSNMTVSGETSLNYSMKIYKKNKKTNKSLEASQLAAEETVTNVSLNSDKKQKNKSLVNESQTVEIAALEGTSTNVSLNSDKTKKKKNKSLLNDSQIVEIAASEEMATNLSLNSNNNKKKKNKSFLDDFQTVDIAASEEMATNISLNSDKKKKKNKSLLDDSQTVEIAASEEAPENVSLHGHKKKKKNKSQQEVSVDDAAPEEPPIDVSLGSEKKKKNKLLLDVSQVTENTAIESTPTNIQWNSDKKKKKNKSLSGVFEITEHAAIEETPTIVQLNSDKKKMKKNKLPSDVPQVIENTVAEETPINVSLNSDKKKKKIRKDSRNIEENTASEETKPKRDKRAKKPKSLDALPPAVDNTGEDSDEAPMEVAYRSTKKLDIPEPEKEESALAKSKNKFKKKKKNNKSQAKETTVDMVGYQRNDVKATKRKRDQSFTAVDDDFQVSAIQKYKKIAENVEGGNTLTRGLIKNKPNKKRKFLDDDDDLQSNSKVFKKYTSEKINIPRLPDSIVNQLDDQPKPYNKQKKATPISTVPFKVEEGPRRKNKPSNYLEQSVYLNDSISPEKKKQKTSKKAPKVLPFTPTAITSDTGYTSNFKINVLPENIQFTAQAHKMRNLKDEYLNKQRLKKLRVEHFKRQKSHMLAKF